VIFGLCFDYDEYYTYSQVRAKDLFCQFLGVQGVFYVI
jgi:hypothetical protein